MSQVYDDDNNLVPVTIIQAGPCPVLQVKSEDEDGYSAIQIGYNPNGKSKKANRCSRGHSAKAEVRSRKDMSLPRYDVTQTILTRLLNHIC